MVPTNDIPLLGVVVVSSSVAIVVAGKQSATPGWSLATHAPFVVLRKTYPSGSHVALLQTGLGPMVQITTLMSHRVPCMVNVSLPVVVCSVAVVVSTVVVVKQSATPGSSLGTHVALFDSSNT